MEAFFGFEKDFGFGETLRICIVISDVIFGKGEINETTVGEERVDVAVWDV